MVGAGGPNAKAIQHAKQFAIGGLLKKLAKGHSVIVFIC